MNLEKYQELAGVTIPTPKQAKYTATIRRTKAMLESLLGYSLSPKNLYTEKGKVQFEGYLPVIDNLSDLSSVTLLAADQESGTYKLFPFNEFDKFLHVDPFNNVYAVKLVLPVPDGEFITLTDLQNIVPQYDRDNVGKYIERRNEWFTWERYRTLRSNKQSLAADGLMLAVDADWISCYPDDLMYLWADMVTHYADANANIKSESVDGHSWSKGAIILPQDTDDAKKLLVRYAGPFGAIVRNPVR